MSFLLASDRRFLWGLAALWTAASLKLILGRTPRLASFAAVFFGVLILGAVELSARFVISAGFPGAKQVLAQKGRLAYPELSVYRGHPFLQFIGNPNSAIVEDKILGGLGTFNNLGFIGPDFHIEKPLGTLRIACLGASTTADGYPKLLANYLTDQIGSAGPKIETMNFGHGLWTTAHSLANFVFNVRDFSPDYVVIHHGANEQVVRGFPGEFRPDYAHTLKPFEVPLPADWIPIRMSVIYRFLRFIAFPHHYIDGVYEAMTGRHSSLPHSERYNFTDELKPFRRNIETIIDLALLDGSVPVLTTQPYSTEPTREEDPVKHKFVMLHLQQANAVVREIAAKYGGRILFCDLDELMSGKENEKFKDQVHLTDDGIQLKAKAIGQTIFTHLKSRLPVNVE